MTNESVIRVNQLKLLLLLLRGVLAWSRVPRSMGSTFGTRLGKELKIELSGLDSEFHSQLF